MPHVGKATTFGLGRYGMRPQEACYAVFYGEDGDGMGGRFIDDPVITDPQGEFAFVRGLPALGFS